MSNSPSDTVVVDEGVSAVGMGIVSSVGFSWDFVVLRSKNLTRSATTAEKAAESTCNWCAVTRAASIFETSSLWRTFEVNGVLTGSRKHRQRR